MDVGSKKVIRRCTFKPTTHLKQKQTANIKTQRLPKLKTANKTQRQNYVGTNRSPQSDDGAIFLFSMRISNYCGATIWDLKC